MQICGELKGCNQDLLRRDLPGGSALLRLYTSTAGGMCSIPGQGTKIPHAMLQGHTHRKHLLRVYGDGPCSLRGTRAASVLRLSGTAASSLPFFRIHVAFQV